MAFAQTHSHIKYICTVYFLGGVLRYFIFESEYQKTIAKQIEVVTPVNSWKRIYEGVHLMEENLNPYDGDCLHEIPVFLMMYKYLISTLKHNIKFLFITVDILTAHLLYLSARKYMFLRDSLNYANDNAQKSTGKSSLQYYYVAIVYMLNPLVVLSCVGMTATVFHNFFLALLLWSILSRKFILSTCSLAITTVQSMYPAILLSPVLISLHQSKKSTRTIVAVLCSYIAIVGAILFVCYKLFPNFAENSLSFIFVASDFKPNIGLFWYFFTEMFEHFRMLFIWSFQINASVLYLIPLSLKFSKNITLLFYSLVSLMAVFKSYPSAGDVGLAISLLPLWKEEFNYMQQGFLLTCMFMITSVLGPIVWNAWIYSLSANANFYFGVTLAFATAQIFMITDVLFAYIKREFDAKLKTGKIIKSPSTKLILK